MNNYSEKFEKMRKAGSLASSTLDMITDYIKPGLSTNKIDELCYCLLYTSPSPRDTVTSRMPSSA